MISGWQFHISCGGHGHWIWIDLQTFSSAQGISSDVAIIVTPGDGAGSDTASRVLCSAGCVGGMLGLQDFHITCSVHLNVIIVMLRALRADPSCGNPTDVVALFDMMTQIKYQVKKHFELRFTTRRCIKASAHARAQGRSRCATRARAAPAPGFVRHAIV